jgi:programmed cell death 6-interacting protein
LPFRKTHSVALSAAIKQYISTKYDQHPDMFKQDLGVIDNLRRDAVNVKEPHVSGLKKIAAYAAQLAWIGGKFPIDVCLAAKFKLIKKRIDTVYGRLAWTSHGIQL